jgi:hypothetical protein
LRFPGVFSEALVQGKPSMYSKACRPFAAGSLDGAFDVLVYNLLEDWAFPRLPSMRRISFRDTRSSLRKSQHRNAFSESRRGHILRRGSL